MNIIQAIQAAEQGSLITNNFLKMNDFFLKYINNGVFFQYKIIDKKAIYKYEVRDFSMGHVLTTSWEIVETNYFKE